MFICIIIYINMYNFRLRFEELTFAEHFPLTLITSEDASA